MYLRVLGGGFCFLPGPRENCGLEELARVLGQHQKQIIETTTKDTKGSTKTTMDFLRVFLRVFLRALGGGFCFFTRPRELASGTVSMLRRGGHDEKESAFPSPARQDGRNGRRFSVGTWFRVVSGGS